MGYGDYVPKDTSGRIIAVVLMLVGIGFLSLLTASFASWSVQQDAASDAARERTAEEELSRRLGELEVRLERLDSGEREADPVTSEILEALQRIERRLGARQT